MMMNYLEHFNFYGVEAKQIPCIKESGKPTTDTEGVVGLLYMNTDNGDLYKFTSLPTKEIVISTDEAIENCYVTGSNGVVVKPTSSSGSYNQYNATDYLDISELAGATVTVSCSLHYNCGFAIYDKDKTYITGANGYSISKHSGYSDYEITLPENAAFIAMTIWRKYANGDISRCKVTGTSGGQGWVLQGIKIGESEDEAFSGKRGVELEGAFNDFVSHLSKPSIVFPEMSVAVVGHEWNMYFDNVIECDNIDNYELAVSVSPSLSNSLWLSDCLRTTPTDGDVGNHTVSVTIKDRVSGYVYDTSSFVLRVIADIQLADKKVIFIGDSLTRATVYPAEVQTLSQGGITSIGSLRNTVTPNGGSYTASHEGRSGWASYNYTESTVVGTTTNPFINPDSGAFDFAYYMGAQNFSSVDVVCLNLGTNGMGEIERTCSALDIMINSIHAFDSNIKIIISLITPPAKQDGAGIKTKMGSSATLKRQALNLVRAYLEKYQGVTTNVFVSEVYFALDTKRDFATEEQIASSRNPQVVVRQTNNVHPSSYGYLKFADVYYNNILYRLTH